MPTKEWIENNPEKWILARRKNSESHKGSNNHMYGKENKWGHHTEETRNIISIKNRGKKRTEEFKKRLSKYLRGKNNPMWGKNHTNETKGKIRQKALGRKLSDETKEKISEKIKLSVKRRKRENFQEFRKPYDSMSKKFKGRHNHWLIGEKNPAKKPEIRKKISENLKLYYSKERILHPQKLIQRNLKNAETNKRNWQNPAFKEKMVKKILKGLWKRPTSLEKQFTELLQKNNLPFEYVGDGRLILGGVNPDFIDTNDSKLIIEVADEFFHKNNYAEIRSKIFSNFGYKTLILWGEDFRKSNWKGNILTKVQHFMEKQQ